MGTFSQPGRVCDITSWGDDAGYQRENADSPKRDGLNELPDFFRPLAERAVYEQKRGLVLVTGNDVNLLIHNWLYGHSVHTTLFILSRRNELLMEKTYWAPSIAGRCFLRELGEDGGCRIDPSGYATTKRHRDPAFWIGSSGNWGHWIADDLPKLAYLDMFPSLSDRSLVFDTLSPLQRECLDLMGIDAARILEVDSSPIHNEHQLFDDLAVPGLPPRVDSYDFVRSRLFANITPCSGGAERVYLSRSRLAPRSRVFNGEEVEDLFRKRGFAILHPETLSLRETLDMVHGADILAAPLGASMGCMALARPAAVHIHLVPERMLARAAHNPSDAAHLYYYLPFKDHMFFVMGAFNTPGQLEYAQRHQLRELDLPHLFEPSALDIAILQAEKMILTRKRGIA
jgi:hypothetical protein